MDAKLMVSLQRNDIDLIKKKKVKSEMGKAVKVPAKFGWLKKLAKQINKRYPKGRRIAHPRIGKSIEMDKGLFDRKPKQVAPPSPVRFRGKQMARKKMSGERGYFKHSTVAQKGAIEMGMAKTCAKLNGKSKGKTPSDFDKHALAQGVKVEMEHTKDRATARKIAMDHLTEDPKYYVKLKKIHKSEKHGEGSMVEKGIKSAGIKWTIQHGIHHGSGKHQLYSVNRWPSLGGSSHYFALRQHVGVRSTIGRYNTLSQAKTAAQKHHNSYFNKSLSKASNTIDIDTDAGFTGIADYSQGQVSMRVEENHKCDGCLHYDKNQSACRIGLVPVICGDGSHPEIGFAPATSDKTVGENWKQTNAHMINTSTQAPAVPYPGRDYAFRVSVLGDEPLSLAERMTLVKAAMRDPSAIMGHIWYHRLSPAKRLATYKKHEPGVIKTKGRRALMAGKHRPPKGWVDHMMERLGGKAITDNDLLKSIEDMTGVKVLPPMQADLQKSKMGIDEFADVMGTTADVVREIAFRLGSKDDFALFIKSKLPDIRMAFGLTERDVTRLYNSAVNTIKSLSSTEWEMWKGVDFQGEPNDAQLAQAITQHGLLDLNGLYKDSIITPAEPMAQLAAPTPIQEPQQDPIHIPEFIGGSLSLADDIGKVQGR